MRINLARWFILAAVTMGAAAMSSSWAQESGASLKRGEALLTKNCARCHATGTRRTQPASGGSAVSNAVAQVSDRWPWRSLGRRPVRRASRHA